MAEWNRFRWAFLAMAIVGVAGWASAQRVAAYSPAQTTAGYLPASDLAVTITLEQVQVPPALPGYGMRAYWDVQGGTRIPVSGTPGATTAIVSVAPALRTIGQHTVIFCVVFNTGETQIESCTNPATSARFTVNAAPGITNASLLPGASVNTPYSVALTASGGTGARSWSLGQGSALPPGLSLNPTTGAISGTPTQGGIFNFTVVVTDSLGVTGSRLFALSVNTGLSIVTPATLPTAGVGVTYSTTIQVAGGVPPYSFSANENQLPPGLVLNANTGVLSGTPSVAGNYTFLVTVFDSRESSIERTFFMTVSESVSAPTILTASPLADATLGVSYSQTFAASGGNPPYQFFLASGQLPPGLTLNSQSGTLSGVPAQTGSFNFVIDVMDSRQRTSNKAFVLRVVEGIAIVTTQLPSGTVGVSYADTLIAVTGGVAPYSFSLGGATLLPPGLTLNPTNGEIGGTPSQAGVFAFQVVVRDSLQRQATRNFSISIGAGLRFRTSSPLPSGQVAESYLQFVEMEGGTAPYQLQVIAGSLPPGLALSESGRLAGTPATAVDATFTIRATDSSTPALNAERQFTLRISAALVISTETLPQGTVQQPYSVALSATGGVPAYAFTVSAGTLPPGLLLASNGTLSGTPTTQGSFPFTVRVTDQEARTGTRAFTLEVRPAAVAGATVTLQTPNPSANTQQEVDVALSAPRTDVVEGTLILSFASSTTPSVDDLTVRFMNGSREQNFQIPAGQTSAVFGQAERALFQAGTVAGTITMRAQLRVNGIDATPNPPPTTTVVLPPLAPTLVSLNVTRVATGLNVVVRGFSTPRNITTATLNFTARAGSNITSGLSFTVNLAPAFTTWYTSAPSAAVGSQFQLTLPIAVSGDATEITGLSIALTNTVGGSNSLNATF